MKVTQAITTRFEPEAGDTIGDILRVLHSSPGTFRETPISLVPGGFEVTDQI